MGGNDYISTFTFTREAFSSTCGVAIHLHYEIEISM